MSEQKFIAETVGDLADKPLPKHIGGALVRFEDAGKSPKHPNWGTIFIPGSPVMIATVTSYAHGLCSIIGVTDQGRPINALLPREHRMELLVEGNPDLAMIFATREFSSLNYRDHIGADPELFVEDEDGSVIPAFEFLPSKQATRGEFESPYWDGYQGEFTVTPYTCQAYTIDKLRAGMNEMLANARSKFPKAKLSINTVVEIPRERLENDDPKYVQFGCTPSLNAYGEKPIRVDGATIPFRSSGGHMHFSYTGHVPTVVKELDRILGVISVPLFQYYEDVRRRSMYGKAGEYRLTKYGFEYRPLSSAWLIHPGVAHMMFEIARHLLGIRTKDQKVACWDVTEDEARTIINNLDVELAVKVLKRNESALMGLMLSLPGARGYDRGKLKDAVLGMIYNGVHTVLTNPDEYSHVWKLGKNEWVTHSDGACGNWRNTTSHLISTGKLD